MKSIRLIPVLVTILSCIACDRREFEISDKSRLENISLEISDTTGQWLIGTTRTFTIKCIPDYARVQELKLESSDESIFKIIQSVSVNSFDVTAIKEGEAVIYASADNKKVEKSFSVYDNSIKKEDFEVKLFIQSFSGQSDKTEIPEKSTLDAGGRFYLSASSICETPAYDLASSNETVISTERYNNGSWVIYARTPGKCDLVLTVEDGLGNSFSYRYAVLVYGHINLTCTYDISEYLKNGNTGVYSCYLDYYYSGWKKLGKSATTPLFLGINGDDQLKAMNIFDANGNYIGEGKTVVTNTITSFSEVFGSSSGFVKNKYQVALNLSKSKIPKSIEILSHYKNEKEYNVPPMYEIKLGKATTKYCVPITTINICKDTDQQNDVYKPFLVIEATEVGLGEPIFRAPEEMPTYAKLYLSVENGLKVITALTGTSLGVVGWFFVIFIILCILYCMGKCCGSTSDNYHSGSGVIV